MRGYGRALVSLEQPEIGRRIRAARGYADGMSQPDLAGLLQMSEGYLRQVENGKQLKPVEAAGLIERVSEICGVPVSFFTADFGRLDNEVDDASFKELEAAVERATRDLRDARRALDQQIQTQRSDLRKLAKAATDNRHQLAQLTKHVHELGELLLPLTNTDRPKGRKP